MINTFTKIGFTEKIQNTNYDSSSSFICRGIDDINFLLNYLAESGSISILLKNNIRNGLIKMENYINIPMTELRMTFIINPTRTFTVELLLPCDLTTDITLERIFHRSSTRDIGGGAGCSYMEEASLKEIKEFINF